MAFSRSRPRPLAFLTVVVAGTLLAAACGDGTPDPDPQSPATSATIAQSDGTPTGTAVSGEGDASSANDDASPHPPIASGEGLLPGDRAPIIEGTDRWFNSPPLEIAAENEAGRVVLIDFWTYTCVNCIRTLPFLRAWHEKYAEHGLTVIGVHAPEFDFERDADNVARAIAEYELTYPVVQDNDMVTWRNFLNHFWPAKYLIGHDGRVHYVHFGEGSYDETEDAIRDALASAGHDVAAIPAGGVEPPRLDPEATGVTRELYGGYNRNYHPQGVYAGQEAYYLEPDRETDYVDDEPHGHNRWYLQGRWRNEIEAIVHARTTSDLEDYLLFRFVARSVNVVMRADENSAHDVFVELDGRWLTPEEAGPDIQFDGDGRSFVHVDEARMFELLELDEVGDRELTMRSNSDAFAMYAVTFGVNLEGP